tara:strand:- start:1477 stop:1611 length:135 start_codon:yes stop_codon:yes gene_type:complete
MEEKEKYEIPKLGSLGLLALGARGLIEWRKVRDAENPENKTDEK